MYADRKAPYPETITAPLISLRSRCHWSRFPLPAGALRPDLARRDVYRGVSFLARKLRRSARRLSLPRSLSLLPSVFLPANISAALPAARSPRPPLDRSFLPSPFFSLFSPFAPRFRFPAYFPRKSAAAAAAKEIVSAQWRRSRGGFRRGDRLTRPRCHGWQERRPRTTAERRHGVTVADNATEVERGGPVDERED